VRLLILCATPEERAIVTLYRYHRAELADVAASVGIPLARVAELYESIRTRVRVAQDKHERERTVAQAAEGTRYQPHR
jgi:DNA-directed RNA polymerase specialized sigma24 family protein